MPRVRYVKSKREQRSTKVEIRRKKAGKSHRFQNPKKPTRAAFRNF